MEKQLYLVLLHYGDETSSKVVISLDRVDFFLSRGYTVEFVQPIRVLSDKKKSTRSKEITTLDEVSSP
jgi:hypothetical protein